MASLLKTDSITYTEDIIQEMSLELAIPERELAEIIKLNIEYLKLSVQIGDNLLIQLPKLCKLRMNNRLAMSYVGSFKNTKYKKRSDKVKNLVRKLDLFNTYKQTNDDWKNLLNVKNPLFERLWKKSKRIKYVTTVNRNMYKMIEEVEGITNKIIQKIK
jgi:hypothetical protein